MILEGTQYNTQYVSCYKGLLRNFKRRNEINETYLSQIYFQMINAYRNESFNTEGKKKERTYSINIINEFKIFKISWYVQYFRKRRCGMMSSYHPALISSRNICRKMVCTWGGKVPIVAASNAFFFPGASSYTHHT